jgi:invasion protein IalB
MMRVQSVAGGLCGLVFAMQVAQVELAQAQTAPQTSLPGGATSLQETFQDWQVNCAVQANGKRCTLSQQQFGQNRQRLLAIELAPGDGANVTGTLVLPFGLLLEAGVTTQIDDKPTGKPLRFRTCLPAGCVVPLQFDGAAASALRAGTALKFIATPSESNEALTFSISLKGLPAALSRTAALMK